MGTVADAALAEGGEVLGIIPRALLEREVGKREIAQLVVTRTMYERKERMIEASDAFVALPGGIGTLEELVEQLTWAQLGRHKKPILIANLGGFWNGLLGLFEHMDRAGFIHSANRLNFLVVDKVEDIVPALQRAAAAVSEAEKAGEPETVERM